MKMDNIKNKEILEKIEKLNYFYLQSKSMKALTLKEQEEQGLLREYFIKLYKQYIE